MYQVQYKQLGQWINASKICESLNEAKMVKNGIENVHSKVRIIIVKD